MLNIAVSKGILLDSTISVLKKSGFDTGALEEPGRRLLVKAGDISYILARPADVPIYVENGAADLGIAGKDALIESGSEALEMLDLKIGKCRFVLAQPEAGIEKKTKTYQQLGQLTVATKYPRIAKDYLDRKGIQAEIITLRGSIELAPITGLADVIIDLMTTGKTLAENKLKVVDEILKCSARLIANSVSARLKYDEIQYFIKRLKV